MVTPTTTHDWAIAPAATIEGGETPPPIDDGPPPALPPPTPSDPGWSTDEWWEIDGVVLNNLAYNISTISGTEQLPPMRGENIQIGNRPGRRYVPKVPDERTISLGMWVRGGGKHGELHENQRARFRENWEELKALFGQPGRQMVAKRRYRFLDGIHERTGLVEIAGPMDLSPQGHTAGQFVVDLKMADPFWYGTDQRVIGDRTGITTGGFVFPLVFPLVFDTDVTVEYGDIDITVVYEGVYESRPSMRIDGPITNPKIWHVESGATLEVITELAEGEWLDFDFENNTILWGGVDSRYNLLATGSSWFALKRGTNTIRFGGTAGAGKITIQNRPNYW